MENKETRLLIRDLADALLDLIGNAQADQDDFDENSYARERDIYDRAVAWLAAKREEQK